MDHTTPQTPVTPSSALLSSLHLDPFLHLSLLHLKKNLIHSPKSTPHTVESIKSAMLELGLTPKIRNLAYSLSCSEKDRKSTPEILQVEQARDDWKQSIYDELLSVCSERGVSIIGPDSAQNKKIRYIFDSEDLFDAIKRIPCSSNMNASLCHNYGLIKLRLSTPDHSALRTKFSELHPCNRQYGMDETFLGSSKFIQHRQEVGVKVLQESYVPISRQYARYGIPAGLRPEIYRVCLNLPRRIGAKEGEYYNSLREKAKNMRYNVVDELFEMDSQTIISNSMSFFPFLENITNVVLAFSRDSWVVQNSTYTAHESIKYEMSDGSTTSIPSSGVQPFKGFVNYIAPLSLVYEDEERIYFTFRGMYSRLWCKLNVISSDSGTLIHLCKTFEDLLLSWDPALFMHLLSVNVAPLSIAFTWIHLAFTNVLETEQLLLLWDRLVGYDDLLLLPVLSAAIFTFRSETLMCTSSAQEVKDILDNNSGRRLKVMPILQAALFGECFK
ncbi:hypothetical protein TrST_g12976 [Triparma strigata]|uniref:Rab-GAP TBC domain-containing protein n=1 Tax=Triparma strigata TaxID=1606541 RepID=A0A9W7ETE4_9STRA|nr:hypothetical protein TrST_g12976 [Triparma strigata]